MEHLTTSVAESSNETIKLCDNQEPNQENDEARKALKVLARLFLNTKRNTKSDKQQLARVEDALTLIGKKEISARTSNFLKSIDGRKKKRKPDHNFLLDQRSEIQYLVDFNSTRIELHEFPLDPFSKHPEVIPIFKLIILDKEPVTKLVLCSKCRKLLVRYRPSGTNLIRHYQRHKKIEEEEKHQGHRQSSKRKIDEFRKRREQNLPKVSARKEFFQPQARHAMKETSSDRNVASGCRSLVQISGLHNPKETSNNNLGQATCSLNRCNEGQSSFSEVHLDDEIVMLDDDRIPTPVVFENNQEQLSREIIHIQVIQQEKTQEEAATNVDHEPGILKIESDW